MSKSDRLAALEVAVAAFQAEIDGLKVRMDKLEKPHRIDELRRNAEFPAGGKL